MIMDTSELDRLIIEHLADLEATGRRIEAIETRIWQVIGDRAKAFAKGRGWTGGFDASDEDIWLAPAVWRQGDYMARFYFGWGERDTDEGLPGEPWFGLARLTGVNGGRLCLWLGHSGIGARQWKPAAKKAAASMSDRGFSFSDRAQFFLDCTPSQKAVALGLENDDLSAAMKPIEVALERAGAAAASFGTLLKKAATS